MHLLPCVPHVPRWWFVTLNKINLSLDENKFRPGSVLSWRKHPLENRINQNDMNVTDCFYTSRYVIDCAFIIWCRRYSGLPRSTNKFSTTNDEWMSGVFRPPLCTYRLNWTRQITWGWWGEWDDTALQTQHSKFEPWRSKARITVL